MERLSRRLLPALLLVLVLAAAGCTSSDLSSTSSSSSSTTSAAAGTITLENGGTVTVAVSSLPTNFNPLAPPGGNRITNEVMAAVLPHAFVRDRHFQQVADPGFVLSAEVYGLSPFTVVYKLNPKAVWSDGTPISVADFIYDWHEELHWAPLLAGGGIVAGYRDISSITGASGGSTVRVVFRRPFAEWESLFSYLIPAHIAERYGWVAAFQGFDPAKVISGGPFEIASFEPGKRLVLVRNPRYWSTPAHLDRIVLEKMSSSAALAGLEAGTVTLAETSPGADVTNVIARAAQHGRGLLSSVQVLPTLWQLCINSADPVLAPTKLRRALEHSINRGEVTTNSAGLVDWTETPDNSRLTMAGEPGSGGNFQIYNEPLAMKLYGQAAFARGTDGEIRFGGNGPVLTLSLDVPKGNQLLALAAASVAAQLQAIGVRVVVSFVPLGQLLGRILPQGAYQLAIAPFLVTPNAAGMAAVYTPAATEASLPWSMSSPVWSAPGTEPGAVEGGVVTRDVFGLSDPAVARRFEEAMTNLNLDLSQLLLGKADTQLWQDAPTVPLFQQPVDLVAASSLVGVSESPTWAGLFWDAADWAIRLAPPIPLPTFAGITPVSPSAPPATSPASVPNSTSP